jgi:hypothetical protein
LSRAQPAAELRSGRAASFAVLLVFVFVFAGSWLRALEWFEPWEGVHRAWGGAVYANMARNLTRYDVSDTKLGLIASTGVVDPEEFEFYYHHPPLNVWTMALSFEAFGAAEWSARAVPLAAAVAMMLLLYALARHLYSPATGLAAVALFAFIPGEIFYADHVDPYGSLSLAWVLLAVFGYARYHTSGRTRDLAIAMVGVLGGCLTTWTPYFAVPLMLAHAALVFPRAHWREHSGMLALPLCAVAAFGLFAMHRSVLMGGAASPGAGESELYGSLLDKFIARGVWATARGGGFLEAWRQHGLDAWRLFTPLPILLFALWLIDLARRGLAGALSARDGFPLILLSYGILHGLVFPGTLQGHDFLVRSYAVGLSLCGGVVLGQAWQGLQARSAALALACGLLALVGGLSVALPRAADLRELQGQEVELVLRAETIRDATRPETLVLLASRPDRVLQYYIDRPVEFDVATADRLKELARLQRDAVWVVGARAAPEANRALAGTRHFRHDVAGLALYRVSSDR